MARARGRGGCRSAPLAQRPDRTLRGRVDAFPRPARCPPGAAGPGRCRGRSRGGVVGLVAGGGPDAPLPRGGAGLGLGRPGPTSPGRGGAGAHPARAPRGGGHSGSVSAAAAACRMGRRPRAGAGAGADDPAGRSGATRHAAGRLCAGGYHRGGGDDPPYRHHRGGLCFRARGSGQDTSELGACPPAGVRRTPG